jgi:hypothetical protein
MKLSAHLYAASTLCNVWRHASICLSLHGGILNWKIDTSGQDSRRFVLTNKDAQSSQSKDGWSTESSTAWPLCSCSNHIQIVFKYKIDVLKIVLPTNWIGQTNLARPVHFNYIFKVSAICHSMHPSLLLHRNKAWLLSDMLSCSSCVVHSEINLVQYCKVM